MICCLINSKDNSYPHRKWDASGLVPCFLFFHEA
ncbi:unnamed protein product [Musa acuminata subsp. malaccensis]|nr:unnamed protein product [Musa acuminata subsp. malaccensis]